MDSFFKLSRNILQVQENAIQHFQTQNKKMELNNISNCERQIGTQKQENKIDLHLEEEVSV